MLLVSLAFLVLPLCPTTHHLAQRPLLPIYHPHPLPSFYSLLTRRMTKQKTHTLPIMRPPARLRQRRTNINRLQPLTPLLLLRMRHRIRHHHPAQLTAIQRLDRVPGQYAMRHDRHHLRRPVRHHRVGGFHERPACVRHVIHHDGDAGTDVPDEHHACDFAGAGALFVDEGEGQVEAVGNGGCSAGRVSISVPAKAVYLQARTEKKDAFPIPKS